MLAIRALQEESVAAIKSAAETSIGTKRRTANEEERFQLDKQLENLQKLCKSPRPFENTPTSTRTLLGSLHHSKWDDLLKDIPAIKASDWVAKIYDMCVEGKNKKQTRIGAPFFQKGVAYSTFILVFDALHHLSESMDRDF